MLSSQNKRINEILKNQNFEEHLPFGKAGPAIIDGLKSSIKEVPLSILTLFFYSKVCQVLAIDHVHVSSAHITDGLTEVPINMYAIAFMGSGKGKDRTVSMLNNALLKAIKNDYYARYMIRYEEKRKELFNEAKEKYPGAKGAILAEYVKDRELHVMEWELENGTPQSVRAYRHSYAELGLGGVYYRNEEFADYFENANEFQPEFLSVLKQSWDGELLSSGTKGQKKAYSQAKVPMNLLAYTSNYKFTENNEIRDRLLKLFARGFARRSFVCLEKDLDEIPKNILSAKERLQIKKTVRKEQTDLIKIIQGFFMEMYEANISTSNLHNTYVFTEEADILFEEYTEHEQQQEQQAITNKAPEHILSEIKGRVWRTIRLAGAIAAFEHPTDFTVHEVDAENAIYLTEYYNYTYRQFFDELNKEPYDILYETLVKAQKPLSKMDIRKLKLVKDAYFKKWFEDALDVVKELAQENKMELTEETVGRNGVGYRLVSEEKAEDDENEALVQKYNKNKVPEEYEIN